MRSSRATPRRCELAGSTINLIMAPDGYTDEDPAAIWTFSTTTLITFTQGTDTPPAVKKRA